MVLLRQLNLSGDGVISTQVLQEHCNVGLRKLGLDSIYLRKQLKAHQQFEVVQVTPAIIQGALDLHQTRSLSFYDALIVQTAKTAGCKILYSEDMQAEEIINGVKIVNPFNT